MPKYIVRVCHDEAYGDHEVDADTPEEACAMAYEIDRVEGMKIDGFFEGVHGWGQRVDAIFIDHEDGEEVEVPLDYASELVQREADAGERIISLERQLADAKAEIESLIIRLREASNAQA